jgi:hypothetical protein
MKGALLSRLPAFHSRAKLAVNPCLLATVHYGYEDFVAVGTDYEHSMRDSVRETHLP